MGGDLGAGMSAGWWTPAAGPMGPTGAWPSRTATPSGLVHFRGVL